MQDDCGVEPEVIASSARQTNAEMTAGSNRAVTTAAIPQRESLCSPMLKYGSRTHVTRCCASTLLRIRGGQISEICDRDVMDGSPRANKCLGIPGLPYRMTKCIGD